MHTLKATGASSLSLPEGSYIYALAPCSAGLAAISSDDSLRLIDSANLKQISVLSSQTHSGGVTCLRTGAGEQGTLLATGGRDGKVRLWDANRTAGATVEFEALKNAPVLSVACNAATNTVVAGTELVSSQAVVSFWDIRFPREPRLQYVESHNDDVTELEYHPTQNHILLSGSTDGLVNIYDTTIQDEDDALVQVINHGSVHHAGFLSPDTVYALSHDEVFSIHPMTNPDDPQKEPEPVLFGDLREPLACEYVVQLCPGGAGYLAVGNKMHQRLDLIPLVTPWQFDQTNLWRLPGAHGDEVVRSIYLDEGSRSVFTCGEDGFVRAWREEGGGGDRETEMETETPKPKKKKFNERYKPY